MVCVDDCGMCGICYEDWKHESELKQRSDYRLEMLYDNKPIYSDSVDLEDD